MGSYLGTTNLDFYEGKYQDWLAEAQWFYPDG